MRRIVLALAMAVGLAIGIVVPASALDTSVTLNCSDGTSVALVLDANALTSLTQAVQAMIDYPAGLSCTVIQNPLRVRFGAVVLAASNPFIVAGGRWQVPWSTVGGAPPPPPPPPVFVGAGIVARVPGAWYSLSAPMASSSNALTVVGNFWVNIAVNFHRDNNGVPFGTLNETIPNQTCSIVDENGVVVSTFQVGESHFQSSPLCFTDITSEQNPVFTESLVTHVSGQLPFPTAGTTDVNGNFVAGPAVAEGDILHFGFQDSGVPPGQTTPTTTDMLDGPPDTAKGDRASGCNAAEFPPIRHLGVFDGSKQNGNISVHQ